MEVTGSDGESEPRERYSFAIDVEHAKRLTDLRKKQRREMADWVASLVEESNGGISRAEARLRAQELRRELWPTHDQHVEAAVRQRLAEPDLAGPWEPLTGDEEEIVSLAGRGFGKNYPGFLAKRAYSLPVSLVLELRTAAVRVSEGPLAELEALGLLYNSVTYSFEEFEKRNKLVKQVLSVPRIVRQGLERYGPWPPDEHPPSSLAARMAAAAKEE
ncbi:hypothetical protein [Streptomyces sp. NPDC004267]|uniref:hypothetical protein n=1 Tax=Streptomyces sp. NPDC004267 TaxID=3364694 RepID=UPI0036BBE058